MLTVRVQFYAAAGDCRIMLEYTLEYLYNVFVFKVCSSRQRFIAQDTMSTKRFWRLVLNNGEMVTSVGEPKNYIYLMRRLFWEQTEIDSVTLF